MSFDPQIYEPPTPDPDRGSDGDEPSVSLGQLIGWALIAEIAVVVIVALIAGCLPFRPQP